MTELHFHIRDIAPEAYAVTPTLIARLQVEESSGAVVHALALRCQVRIAPQRRPYTDDEAAGALDLFGPRARWSDTLRPFLWLHTTALVPGFTGTTEAELPLPCSYDFEVSASKYLHALRDGMVPLQFLFTGTVFTRRDNGISVEQVPWDAEASYAMPVAVWQQVMDTQFPATAWLRLGHDSFRALHRYRVTRGLLSADEAVDALLAQATEVVP
jgi:Family of unknown function (DUF6084)